MGPGVVCSTRRIARVALRLAGSAWLRVVSPGPNGRERALLDEIADLKAALGEAHSGKRH
jgi:hypothetical protein